MNLSRNDKILLCMIVQIADTSNKYIKADFVVFPGKEIGYIKKAITYFNKILDHYGKVEIDRSEVSAAKNRLYNNIYKLPSTKEITVPEDDFKYLVVLELTTMQFDEVIENQKLNAEVRKNLKTGNTYIKKFLGYIAEELE